MSFRTTALLFGILMGVFWVFGLLMTLQQRRLDPGLLLPTLAKDKSIEIDTVTVQRGSKKYVFVKTEAGWKLTLPSSGDEVRADETKVREIIDQARKARKSDAADVTRSLSDWGLDAPMEKLTFRKKGGDAEWTVSIGKESVDKNYVYANSSDRPRDVLAIPRNQIDSLLIDAAKINSYRALRFLDASDSDTKLISLSRPADPKTAPIVLEKGSARHWRFKTPAFGPAEYEGPKEAKEAGGVRGLLNDIDFIRVESDKDFEEPGKNVVEEGKAQLRIEIENTTDGAKKGRPAKQLLLIGDKVPGKEQYYARLESDKASGRVAAKSVDALLNFLKNPVSLRSRELAAIDPATVDAVRVSEGKGLTQVLTLYKAPGGGWKVASGDFRHKANENTIQGPDGLLAAIQGKGKIKDFVDVQEEAKQGAAEDKRLGLDNPVAKVVVWTDGLEKEEKKAAKKDEKDAKKQEKKDAKKDEKKDAKKAEKKAEKQKVKEEPRINPKATPVVTLIFSEVKGDNVHVKRVTATGISRVSVPKAVLDKVAPPRGALAYLDTNISPFLATAVAKLELKLPGGRTFVVEREKDKDKAKEKEKAKEKFPPFDQGKWLLVEPKVKDRPEADPLAVESVLASLTGLNAREWVKRVGPKDDLSEFGLKMPTVTAIVTFKPKEGEKQPTTYTYQFGIETKDKGPPGVYGRMTGGLGLQDFVFVVPAEAVRTLKDVELRDRTIFKFDADKVKEIKVTTVEKVGTLEPVFERNAKDRTWTIKSGLTKFNLETARVEGLVRELADLHAERFVSFSGAPEKKQELGDKAKLKIDVLMDDGKTHHILTIGAKEGEAYFAQANSLSGVVFTVSRARFGQLVDEGVAYFGKK